MEQRASKTTAEIRIGPSGNPVISGYASVFNSDSENLGGFTEQVDPQAFTKTLQEADVRALANHDANWLLGRTKAGTLRLMTDQVGLRYEIDVDPSDPDGQRALAKVRSGAMDGASFSFQCVRDQWNWDANPAERRLLEVALIDVGPVTYPAYPDSTAAARALDKIASKLNRPVDELVAALGSGELRSIMQPEPAVEERVGKSISAANQASIRAAIEMLQQMMDGTEPDGDEPTEPDGDETPQRHLTISIEDRETRDRDLMASAPDLETDAGTLVVWFVPSGEERASEPERDPQSIIAEMLLHDLEQEQYELERSRV